LWVIVLLVAAVVARAAVEVAVVIGGCRAVNHQILHIFPRSSKATQTPK